MFVMVLREAKLTLQLHCLWFSSTRASKDFESLLWKFGISLIQNMDIIKLVQW
jgi:hypothetical protein